MSGVPSPTPVQNNFIPPPEPVASTTGVLKDVFWPNCSATDVENGNTVDEPTIWIWSRACAVPIATALKNRSIYSSVELINTEFIMNFYDSLRH